MKNLTYAIILTIVTACNTVPKTEHIKEATLATPQEKSWNITINDNEISYTMIASTMENNDMQFSININENEKMHASMISHFPNIHKYALTNMNNDGPDELILIGTNQLRPDNELIFIFYLDRTEELHQLKRISLPEINDQDPRKELNSINNYSIKPPYIIRKLEYQPLEGELEKETIIYKINDNNETEVVSKKTDK